MTTSNKSRGNWLLLLFFIFLLADLVIVFIDDPSLRFYSKPVLIPLLLLYFMSSLNKTSFPLKKWIILALLFSWAGDMFLLFNGSIFFLLGLSSFLIAHIFYIVFFHKIRVSESIKGNPVFLLPVGLYYFGLIHLLSPYLGNMKLPVQVYAVIISFMFMLAMHMLYLRSRSTGLYLMLGALLFVLSDSILAINKFYQPFYPADLLVMLSYGAAQCCLVEGAIHYIRSKTK